ncbi:hypothetical protein GDO86_017029 [Hymenochirus boettgeri]|uniref:PEHE domain-containing protein n=1 Tax=Hymenochirus boettgeri TaxID=247094 RepID=A0A8T2II48_9PIPI|nr:hypothetical protein GDO86_017029 [Hymenochirus boettgeri]
MSLNNETNLFMDNVRLSIANSSSAVHAEMEQSFTTDFMKPKHIGAHPTGHYCTIFLPVMQTRSSSVCQMLEKDTQTLHPTKFSNTLITGVRFQSKRKVKRELFPESVNQLLAGVDKLWDISLTEAADINGIHMSEYMLNQSKHTNIFASVNNNNYSSSPLTSSVHVPKKYTTKEARANLVFKCLSQQQVLLNRVQRNKKRLQSFLGKHVVNHCNDQIRNFVNHPIHDKEHTFYDSHPNKVTGLNLTDRSTELGRHLNKCLKNGVSCPVSASIRNFSASSKTILKRIEQDLDSDATGSSSEDWDEEDDQNQDKCQAELNWLSVRARTSSCWAWLQSQISELEFKIQNITYLHSQIRKSKRKVMFKDYPGKLLRTPGNGNLSPTKDLDMSPSSPTLLLRNIEKQSAQLTEIVSSLTGHVPPPSDSAFGYKQVSSSSCNRLPTEEFHHSNGICEQIQVKRRKKVKVISSSSPAISIHSSARTRPLHSFQKRRLYRLNHVYPTFNEAKISCTNVHLFNEPLCDADNCSTWESYEVQQRQWLMEKNVCRIDPCLHPVLSYPNELPLNLHLAALLKNNSDIKGYSVHSPLLREEGEMCHDSNISVSVNTVRDPEPADESSTIPNFTEKSSAQKCKSSSMFSATRRRLRSEKSYDIDNIVIPINQIAPTTFEKLQYKEIIIPSWKLMKLEPLQISEDAEMLEDLSDEAYISRHKKLEVKEKARWSLWEQKKWPKRTRSNGTCTIGLHSMTLKGSQSYWTLFWYEYCCGICNTERYRYFTIRL